LRRVEPRTVCVFVALKRACTVELTLYSRADPAPSDAPLRTQQAQTMPLGVNLHVCLVTLRIPDTEPALVPGVSYGYDLRFVQPLRADRLADTGLLSGNCPLGYGPGRLPSFALPPGLATLKVSYGSCRKPHGAGTDALAVLDSLTEAAMLGDYASGVTPAQRQGAVRRPHQLLLGGDQIYADDVSLCLLRVLIDTGKDLLGWTVPEQVTIGAGGSQVPVASDHALVLPGWPREATIRTNSYLTSELIDGHLIFWGEFLAMYIMAWSDALWPRADGGATGSAYDLPSGASIVAAYGLSPDSSAYKDLVKTADKHRVEALNFAKTLPKVRRALANVPTYMIFDDHEVSDDWNLNRQWRQQVKGTPLGHRVLRNALLSYAIFQDWGNQPGQYTSGPGQQLFTAVTFQNGSAPIRTAPGQCDRLLDIEPTSTTAPGPAERMVWDFEVLGPEHQVIALDSRTWRTFPPPPAPPKSAAALISGPALSRQIDARRRADGRLTLLVAPAPVIGHFLVEEIVQRLAVAASGEIGPERWDFEPWAGNRASFEDVLRRLSAFRRVVILSGDVHYAFSNHMAYFRDDTPSVAPARIVQFCSSALKNEETKTYVVGAIGYLGLTSMGYLGFDEDIGANLQQDLMDAMLAQAMQGRPPDAPNFGKSIIDLYFRLIVEERLRAPAVLPSGPWFSDQAFQIVQALAENVVTHQPATQWRYRITYLRDRRDSERRVTDAPGVPSYRPRATLHQARTMVADYGRSAVGSSNIGGLTFRASTGGVIDQVVNRLYWYANGDSGAIVDAPMFTEHVAPLTQPTSSERPVIVK
jgi:hypothetical protein